MELRILPGTRCRRSTSRIRLQGGFDPGPTLGILGFRADLQHHCRVASGHFLGKEPKVDN